MSEPFDPVFDPEECDVPAIEPIAPIELSDLCILPTLPELVVNGDCDDPEIPLYGTAGRDGTPSPGLKIYNTSCETMPPYSIGRVIGLTWIEESQEWAKKVVKPDGQPGREYVVSGAAEIGSCDHGEGFNSGEVTVKYEGGLPSVAQEWGPRAGSWKLNPNSDRHTAVIEGVTDPTEQLVLAHWHLADCCDDEDGGGGVTTTSTTTTPQACTGTCKYDWYASGDMWILDGGSSTCLPITTTTTTSAVTTTPAPTTTTCSCSYDPPPYPTTTSTTTTPALPCGPLSGCSIECSLDGLSFEITEDNCNDSSLCRCALFDGSTDIDAYCLSNPGGTLTEPTCNYKTTTTTTLACSCSYPKFCGVDDGDCTYTLCSSANDDPVDHGCTTTTSTTTTTSSCGVCLQTCVESFWTTTHDCLNSCDCPLGTGGCSPPGSSRYANCTPTTTTCDCNTTTTPSVHCGTGCDWVYFPWDGWHNTLYDCDESYCPCPVPGAPTDPAECPEYHTPCVAPTPTTTTCTCKGDCEWWWIPLLQTWVSPHLRNSCQTAPGCDICYCPEPGTPPSVTDVCQPVQMGCKIVTTTTTAYPCESCYPTTSTSSTTSTTTTPACGTDCVFRWDTGDLLWNNIEDNCNGDCVCYDPVYDGHDNCEVARTPCVDTPPTSTTTTCACDICGYQWNGAQWLLINPCNCGVCPEIEDECTPCSPGLGTIWQFNCQPTEVTGCGPNYPTDDCPEGTIVGGGDCPPTTTTTTAACAGFCEYTCDGGTSTWLLNITACTGDGCICQDPFEQSGHPCDMDHDAVVEASDCILPP